MKKKILLIVLAIVVVTFGLLFNYMKKETAMVTVEHTFSAPIEKVWQIWTDAEAIKNWWSPKDYTAPVIQNDFRLDGVFLFSMKAPDGKISWNTGKYTEIIPRQKIVSTMSFADETGKVVPASQYGVPGEWPDEITVTVEFKDLGGKTQVTVKETGIPMIMYLFAKLGWQQQFDKFEKLLK